MGFDVNMLADDQKDLEMRVQPAERAEKEGGIDVATSFLRMHAAAITKIPGRLDEGGAHVVHSMEADCLAISTMGFMILC